MDPFSLRKVEFRGTTLAAWEIGPVEAPALVISHGGALDHSTFRPLASRLSDRWRVVLWDLPGHGESHPGPEDFSAEVCAQAMAAVMDAVDVKDAMVIGFSFGGVVSQILAEIRPDLVRRFIAYGCLSPHVGRPIIPKPLAGPTVQALFGFLSWDAIRLRFSELCCVTLAGRQRVINDMAAVSKAGFLAMARSNLEARRPNSAFRIRGGVDLIAGALDSNGDAIWKTFRAFELAYPDARRVIIPGAGHCAHQDAPELFEEAIERLLVEPAQDARQPFN